MEPWTVLEVFPSSDGVIRRADVLTLGRGIKRPVSKLAALDVESDESQPFNGGRNV